MKNVLDKIRQRPPGRKNAQGMVEFALILPVLLLMIVGIIEFSRLMFAWIIIEIPPVSAFVMQSPATSTANTARMRTTTAPATLTRN